MIAHIQVHMGLKVPFFHHLSDVEYGCHWYCECPPRAWRVSPSGAVGAMACVLLCTAWAWWSDPTPCARWFPQHCIAILYSGSQEEYTRVKNSMHVRFPQFCLTFDHIGIPEPLGACLEIQQPAPEFVRVRMH